MRAVHLPVYDDNQYQARLMSALATFGVECIDGGGGGNFFRTALKTWQADLLHFHWIHPYLLRTTRLGSVCRATRLLAEVRLLKQSGQRIVWTVHNLQNHEKKHLRIERWFTRRFIRLVDAMICHSDHARVVIAKSFQMKRFPKLHVIPHGNYCDAYPNEVSQTFARRKLRLPDDSFVLLFFGQVRSYKGLPELIHSLREIPHRNLKLVIAGRCNDERLARELRTASDNDPRIHCHLEFIADSEIQMFLNSCDLVVLPYREVLSSGAAVLAMSFGKPCLAPHKGCLPEVVGDAGWLYETNTLPDLKSAIQKAYRERDQVDDFGKLALARANEWTWSRSAEATSRVYQTILNDQTPLESHLTCV